MPARTPIDAIIFDLDDTLLAQDSPDREALRAASHALPASVDVDPLMLAEDAHTRAQCLWRAAATFPYCNAIGISATEGLWARFDGDDPNLTALRAWVPAYRRQTWGDALAAQGVSDAALTLADELSAAFMRERRARHVVFPEVADVLHALRGRYRLGILTNGAPDLQREKVEGSRLGHFFDAIVVSGEEGIGKPDPQVFARTLDRLGVAPERAAMVGDNLTRDVAGARACGLLAVWINRAGPARGAERAGDAAPDAEIDDLRQLQGVIEGQNGE